MHEVEAKLEVMLNRLRTDYVNTANQLLGILLNNGRQENYDNRNLLADVKKMLIKANCLDKLNFLLESQHRLAMDSNDHLHPHGTMNDNTRSQRFVRACENLFPNRELSYLDLGCSGGGLVFDFLLSGHKAMGIDGSSYSLNAQRAEWSFIPNSLFTADISRPFTIRNVSDGATSKFDVISLWEVLEHIPEERLSNLVDNIGKHLSHDGVVIASVALEDDVINGVSYHPTLRPRHWWSDFFINHGYSVFEYELFQFSDHCRGVGNGPLDPNFSVQPHRGFHITLKPNGGTNFPESNVIPEYTGTRVA